MKYLGIDFGTKHIGLATSDEGGAMAFPFALVPNDGKALSVVQSAIIEEGIEALVVGYSLNQAGQENKVAKIARNFIEKMHTTLPVHWQDERFSSLEASRHLFNNRPIANPRRKGHSDRRDDDSAAAIILQRFLEHNQRQ